MKFTTINIVPLPIFLLIILVLVSIISTISPFSFLDYVYGDEGMDDQGSLMGSDYFVVIPILQYAIFINYVLYIARYITKTQFQKIVKIHT